MDCRRSGRRYWSYVANHKRRVTVREIGRAFSSHGNHQRGGAMAALHQQRTPDQGKQSRCIPLATLRALRVRIGRASCCAPALPDRWISVWNVRRVRSGKARHRARAWAGMPTVAEGRRETAAWPQSHPGSASLDSWQGVQRPNGGCLGFYVWRASGYRSLDQF